MLSRIILYVIAAMFIAIEVSAMNATELAGPRGGRGRKGPKKGWSGHHGGHRGRKGPRGAHVRHFETAGQGCPNGTVGQFVSEDLSTVTMMFDNFIAQVGPGTPAIKARLDCRLQIQLGGLAGQQWAVVENEYRGFINLDNGVNAERTAIYSFLGEDDPPAKSRTHFQGPINKDFTATDQIEVGTETFSPCDREETLVVDTQLFIDTSKNPKGKGQMTTDSADHKVQHKLNLAWQDC
jgi:hypothetical protein